VNDRIIRGNLLIITTIETAKARNGGRKPESKRRGRNSGRRRKRGSMISITVPALGKGMGEDDSLSPQYKFIIDSLT